jgi:hypothetical protein
MLALKKVGLIYLINQTNKAAQYHILSARMERNVISIPYPPR